MDLVAAHTAKHPHRTALIEGERSLTWEQFFRTRNRLAHSLAGPGIGARPPRDGHPPQALGEPRPPPPGGGGGRAPARRLSFPPQTGGKTLGAGPPPRALGPLGVRRTPRLTADEVAYILDNSDATAVVVGDAFLPMAERVRGAARVKRWITLGPERRPWAEALDDLLARGSEAPPAAVPAMGGSMIYTAGTTGRPRCARATTCRRCARSSSRPRRARCA